MSPPTEISDDGPTDDVGIFAFSLKKQPKTRKRGGRDRVASPSSTTSPSRREVAAKMKR